MYYPSSENKGADQLRGYREADLRLCFCLCRLLVFPCGGSVIAKITSEEKKNFSEFSACEGMIAEWYIQRTINQGGLLLYKM